LGRTKDDAIGEAFDKVARIMNLPYPGGPKIDKLSKEGEANIELPKTHTDGLNFSFSGIKTAVINTNHNKKDIKKEDICASFQTAVTNELIENTRKAIDQYGFKKVALAGGVSANSYIRAEFQKLRRRKKHRNLLSRYKTMYRQCGNDRKCSLL
jgi:N6-L-threonylcarbamoyladenine synthase